jgi:hypothetical protein
MHAGGDWKPDEGRFWDEIDRRAAMNIGLKQCEVMQAIETCDLDRSHPNGERALAGRRGSVTGPNRISAATKYSFTGKNLTAYGGLLPVAAMLEKLEFQQLVRESVNLDLKRMPRAMERSGFLLGMILAVYVGFSRLNHLQYLEREPMLLGILRVARLPVQSTFWRFLSSLHLTVERQLGRLNARLRERVWAAAHVRLTEVTLARTRRFIRCMAVRWAAA